MGQAKQRRMAQEQYRQLCRNIDLARVAKSVQKVCAAASAHLGTDCLLQAKMAQHILGRLGMVSELVIGHAAWRVGPGDGDVVSHFPNGHAQSATAALYHAWLIVGDHIFDVTTKELPLKARQLDALDGGTTTVQWAPDYVWMAYGAVKTIAEVTASLHPGGCAYRRSADVQALVLRHCRASDGQNEALAWLAYQSPDATVIGPRHLDSAFV